MNIILGTMTFGDQVDIATADIILNGFVRAGHRQVDTAYMYNDGKTEALLGEITSPEERDDLYIATKVNPWIDGGLSPESINRQFGRSLERLGIKAVDLLYLHSPDLNTPIVDSLETCYRLFDAGKFRDFGLSNYAAWQVAEVVEICERNDWMRPIVYQGMYNALTRDVERELFPCLRNYAIAFYAYNPLAGGLLTGKHKSYAEAPIDGRFANTEGYRDRYWKPDYFDVIQELNNMGRKHGISPASAALRWLCHHSMLAGDKGDGIILGASSLDHFDANIAACTQGPLPEEFVEMFDRGWELVRPLCIKYFRP